jgi:lipid-binding SYLF domain-containing protein
MKSGMKKQVEGALREVKSTVKEPAGNVTKNASLENASLIKEGKAERLAGIAQQQAGDAKQVMERLDKATAVFRQIMAAPDSAIPREFLEVAQCIVVVPGLKTAAFMIGGKFGRGFLSCRNKNGEGWSAPGAVRIEGGSFGLQMGGSETDLIMLVMNSRGVDKLLSAEFTLGAEGSIAAGPVGRTASAQTDTHMDAEILSWSRSQGLFMGLALEGATLRQDEDDNASLYGKKIPNREIVRGGVPVPAAAEKLITMLNQYSARKPGATPEGPGTGKKPAVSRNAPLPKKQAAQITKKAPGNKKKAPGNKKKVSPSKKRAAPTKKQAAKKRPAARPQSKAGAHRAAAKTRKSAPKKKTARLR